MLRFVPILLAVSTIASGGIKDSCLDCHNQDKKKGQFSLESLGDNPHTVNAELLRAYKAVLTDEMPPKEKLSTAEKNEILEFLRKSQREITTKRYLTPDEIRNTYSDLFRVDTRFDQSFNALFKYLNQADFSTIESQSYLSPIFLKSLDNVLNDAVKHYLYSPPHPGPGFYQKSPSRVYYPRLFMDGFGQRGFVYVNGEHNTFDLRGKQSNDKGRRMFDFKWGTSYEKVHFPPGTYEIVFEVTSRNRQNIAREKRSHLVQDHRLLNEKARLNLYAIHGPGRVVSHHLGVRKIKQREVPDDEFLAVRFTLDMNTTFRLAASFENGFHGFEMSHLNPVARPSGGGEEVWEMPYLHFKNCVVTQVKEHYPTLHQKMRQQGNVESLLAEFATHSGVNGDPQQVVSDYRHFLKSMSSDEAVDETVKSLLSSDRFLHLDNDSPQGRERWASYALLKSAPDKAFSSSYQNRHENPKGFTEFVLTSKKFRRFTDQLTHELIDLDNIQKNKPQAAQDHRYYDDDLEKHFDEEVKLYVYNLFVNNRPISELIDSDYSYLNDELFGFYTGTERYSKSTEFRKVTFSKRRGGIINTGAFMTATSNGLEGLPFKRSKWFVENCLDVKLPPPPDNIDLETIENRDLPFAERVKLHASNKKCFSCHQHIDEPAMYFYQFNAIGKKMDKLPDGVLGLELAPDLTNAGLSFSVRLISFITGREPNIQDYEIARSILKTTPSIRMRELFHAVVNQYLIQTPR